MRGLVGQPILAAAAFQAACWNNLRTFGGRGHSSLSAIQRATAPPLGCDRMSSLRNFSLARQLASESRFPAGTVDEWQSICSDGSNFGQRSNGPVVPSRTGNCQFSNASSARRREQIRPLSATCLCRDGQSRSHVSDASRRGYEVAGAAERVHRP
jgi:hypothetical protein